MVGLHEGISPSFDEKEKQPQFGAFLQVFVKKKDANGVGRVACLSYPLGPGMSAGQAKETLFGVAGMDLYAQDTFYQSESEELMFLSLPSRRFDKNMLNRFLDTPGEQFQINKIQRKRELGGGVLKEFYDELEGKRHTSAQVSEGQNIFSFSYREDEGKLFGKNREGREGKPLSELALDGDTQHAEMLSALEKELVNMDEGVLITLDKSKTVFLCCALFFREKLGSAVSSMKQVFANMADTISYYFGSKGLSLEADQVCQTCGVAINECEC